MDYFLSLEEPAFKGFEKINEAGEEAEDQEEGEDRDDVKPVFAEKLGDGTCAAVFEDQIKKKKEDNNRVDNFNGGMIAGGDRGKKDVDDNDAEEDDKEERKDLIGVMFNWFEPGMHSSVFIRNFINVWFLLP